MTAGLTQAELGAMVRISASEVSRIELGQARRVPYVTLVLVGAVLGLDLPLRAFPGEEPVRDVAQLTLLARFGARLPELRHAAEVPLEIPGDRRAWDELVSGPGWSVPVEAETRLRDIQALQRRLALKLRDGHRDRMILLLADTRHNRHALRLAGDSLLSSFPVLGRDALLALEQGRCPPASSIILL
jgi:transcriptional regulator with XRE-family HTH domain